MLTLKILVNGALGRMGSESIKAIQNDPALRLVGETDHTDVLTDVISTTKPDVVVDFTHPAAVFQNVIAILNAGCHAVVGTTGLSEAQLNEIDRVAIENGKAALVCPNFAIGAVLMMRFSAIAAAHMPRAEIIEFHHDQKADAPSGTAIKTAEMIHEANAHINAGPEVDETILIEGARGGRKSNVPIHSVRLPGFVASQEVIFGGLGQTLTLRHDTISRESFMPGVVLAVKAAPHHKGLVYGLEKVLGV